MALASREVLPMLGPTFQHLGSRTTERERDLARKDRETAAKWPDWARGVGLGGLAQTPFQSRTITI